MIVVTDFRMVENIELTHEFFEWIIKRIILSINKQIQFELSGRKSPR